MAKSNLTFRRNTTDKLTVKGIMSDDCKTITYTDEYDEVTMSVALKTDEDLELIPTED